MLSLARVEDIEAEELAPAEPPPPRFNNPVGYVRTATGMLRDFGILAAPGGLNDQRAGLIRDMITWMNGQNYELYQMRKRLEIRARERAES